MLANYNRNFILKAIKQPEKQSTEAFNATLKEKLNNLKQFSNLQRRPLPDIPCKLEKKCVIKKKN